MSLQVFFKKVTIFLLVFFSKIFHKNNINLTYIDSRPSRKKLGEYLFFIEFDGYEIDDKSICAIEELKDHTDFIRVLGSYQIY